MRLPPGRCRLRWLLNSNNDLVQNVLLAATHLISFAGKLIYKIKIDFYAKKINIHALCLFSALAVITSCNQPASDNTTSVSGSDAGMAADVKYGGFDSQVKWGEHLVTIGGCNDCHTPKKMGANGPENDMSLMLSGHPAQQPPPKYDPKEAAKNGLIVTQTFTAWTGPWGTTYAANITSDSTGIGMWTKRNLWNPWKRKNGWGSKIPGRLCRLCQWCRQPKWPLTNWKPFLRILKQQHQLIMFNRLQCCFLHLVQVQNNRLIF